LIPLVVESSAVIGIFACGNKDADRISRHAAYAAAGLNLGQGGVNSDGALYKRVGIGLGAAYLQGKIEFTGSSGRALNKYLAAAAVLSLTVLMSLVFVGVIALYGRVYPSELVVGYGGFILQGCAFLALDLFISGLCKNQVTAAVSAFGVNLTLWLIDMVTPQVTLPWLADILNFVSLYTRYEPFLMGQLSWAAIGYYLVFIAFFGAASVYTLDARRWRENA